MIQAASIGLGRWSDQLAESIHGQSEAIQITSCYSRSKQSCSEFSKKFGTTIHKSYEAVLSDSTIDAVIITTPHSLHAKQVSQAAEAGKHVFVEKPFTLTVESGRKAAAKCESAGVVLAVGQNRRFSVVTKHVKILQANGDFGTLLHMEANFSIPSALAYTPDLWRVSRVESPAGGISSLGIHLIDLLCFFGGNIVRVNAQAKRRAVALDMDDTTSALFEFGSGATGYLGCMFVCPYTSFLNLYGTKANAFTELDAGNLRIQYATKPLRPITLKPTNTLRAELEEFAVACKGGKPFRVTPEQAISNVAVMEAIAASAKKRIAVDIDEEFATAWTRSID